MLTNILNYFRARRVLALLICASFLIFSFEPVSHSQQPTLPQVSSSPAQSQYRPAIMIDILHMSDRARSKIVEALIQLNKDTSTWHRVKVGRGGTLSDLILNRYRISSTLYNRTTEVISEAIKKANNLLDVEKLQVGQEILLPILGVMPKIEAAGGKLHRRAALRAQILNFVDSQVYLSKAKDVSPVASNAANATGLIEALRGEGVETLSRQLAAGGVWVSQVSASESDRFFKLLPQDVLDEVLNKTLYAGPVDAYAIKLGFPEDSGGGYEEDLLTSPSETQPSAPPHVPSQSETVTPETDASVFVKDLKPEGTGTYYLFDFFKHKKKKNHECMHGDMAIEAAAQRLGAYGAAHLVKNLGFVQK